MAYPQEPFQLTAEVGSVLGVWGLAWPGSHLAAWSKLSVCLSPPTPHQQAWLALAQGRGIDTPEGKGETSHWKSVPPSGPQGHLSPYPDPVTFLVSCQLRTCLGPHPCSIFRPRCPPPAWLYPSHPRGQTPRLWLLESFPTSASAGPLLFC